MSIGFCQEVPVPRQLISQQVCPRPAGRNGYEEYLLAADIIESPEAVKFLNWEDYWNRNQTGIYAVTAGDVPPKEPERPHGLSLNDDLLTIRREKERRFRRILDLVKAGNAKPVWNPRSSMDLDSLLPELGPFRAISRHLVQFAYVSFANGKSAEGTERLIDALRFGIRISQGPMIFRLVSMALASIVLAGFEEHLSRLSEADCHRIIDSWNGVFREADGLENALRSELAGLAASVPMILKEPERFLTLDSEDPDSAKVLEALKALSPRQIEVVAELIVKRQTQLTQDYIQWIAKSEKNLAIEMPTSAAARVDPRTSIDTLADRVAEDSLPFFTAMTMAEARVRTQLRLLLLHARVLLYRWRHGKLPQKLLNAAAAEECQDPIGEKEFRYVVTSRGTYRLFSEGFGNTGEIELRYRRPPSPDVSPGNEPPGLVR